MCDSQLSPAGAANWSAVNAGAGVIANVATVDEDNDVAPPTATSTKNANTSQARRMNPLSRNRDCGKYSNPPPVFQRDADRDEPVCRAGVGRSSDPCVGLLASAPSWLLPDRLPITGERCLDDAFASREPRDAALQVVRAHRRHHDVDDGEIASRRRGLDGGAQP